jgi:hypothetical protein
MKHDFEIEFIMNTQSARIIDLRPNTRLDMKLQETVTEENVARIFSELVEALIDSGKLEKGNVLCTTFPAGAKRIDNPVVN